MAKKSSKKTAETAAPPETAAETPVPEEGGAVAAVGADGDCVVVCSKMGRDHAIATPFGTVTLRGANSSAIIGGYGKTAVPRKQWDYVERIYGKTAAWKNGVIFAADSDAYADAKAKDMAGVKTGAEPLKPGEVMDGRR